MIVGGYEDNQKSFRHCGSGVCYLKLNKLQITVGLRLHCYWHCHKNMGCASMICDITGQVKDPGGELYSVPQGFFVP